jgi:TIR domain
MKVFISWSGSRSQAFAQALRDWLPLVLHFVEPWLSEADIAAGERWAQSVAKELESCNFGIICVTRENVSAPWILFEAGSLAKSLEGSRVIPLLLDLEFSEIGGPLAQFQAKKADRDGLSETVDSVNHASKDPIPDLRVRQLFDALWPQLEGQMNAVPKHTAPTKPIRPQHEILEELVGSIRAIDTRIRTLEENSNEPRTPRYRRHRIPFMLHELPHIIGERPGDPIGLLVLASMFREEAPWLYEIGLEAYRSTKAGKREEARLALRRFQRAAEFTLRGPFPAEELGLDPRMFHIIMREIEHFAEEEPNPDEPAEPKRPHKKKLETP